jgi:hypothetical protein
MSDQLPAQPPRQPQPPAAASAPVPAQRRVSSAELEAVIRRASELQAARGEDGDEGISEADLLRIGKELGLEPANLRRALAEVRGGGPELEHGMLTRVMGEGVVRASRVVAGDAEKVKAFLEEYLCRCEFMVVERRFPDHTLYVEGQGIAAALGRTFGRMGQRHSALGAKRLHVAVVPLEAGYCMVDLWVDLGGTRAGIAAGLGSIGFGGAAVLAAFMLATPAPDLLALLGVPAIAGSMGTARGIFGSIAARQGNRLEAFLDRLEHGELRLPPGRPDWRKQLGV